MTLSSHGPAEPAKLVTVRPDSEFQSRQNLPNFLGVSAETAGSTGISMNMVIIPPGGCAEPHLHKGFETAIYLLQGRVLTRFGDGLRESATNQAGDFIFIPAGLPHQPVNLSETEPAIAIVARNDPREQESVELYPANLA